MSELELPAPLYSVVVPVYNSSKGLMELTRRLQTVFEETIQESFEIVFVNDGSRNPETTSVLRELLRFSFVKVIHLRKNYGKPGAVVCGFAHAKGRWIVTIDDDLQQLPEDIPALNALRDHDVVIGRIARKQHTFLINLGSKVKQWFDRRILGVDTPMAPLKLIRRDVIEEVLKVRTPRPFIPALLSSATNDFVCVDIRHEESVEKKSRYSFFRRASQFSNLLIGNSSVLLRFIALTGFATAIAGFIFAGFTVLRAFLGHEFLPGWASLITLNLVFGGLILVGLGLNGEYLLRILENVSHKAPFSVREVQSGAQSAKIPDPEH